MKKTLSVLVTLLAVFIIFGCASTKDVGMKTTAKNTEIVDWAIRTLDGPAKPEWLKKLVLGNSDVFKTDFGIEKSYIIKY